MTTRDTLRYGPAIGAVLEHHPVIPLGPGIPEEAMRPHLEKLNTQSAFLPHRVRDEAMALAAVARLWFYHNFLNECHDLCQRVKTPTGSYWHALVHRREPDYSNSKYWFHRVGQHPIYLQLQKEASQLAAGTRTDRNADFLRLQPRWNAAAFVDLCAQVAGTGSEGERLCERIQYREWDLLFNYCYAEATSGR